MFQIRIYKYADPDPGPYFSPFGSGSGCRSGSGNPKKTSKIKLKLYHKSLIKTIIISNFSKLNLMLIANDICKFKCCTGKYRYFFRLFNFSKLSGKVGIQIRISPCGSRRSFLMRIRADSDPNHWPIVIKIL